MIESPELALIETAPPDFDLNAFLDSIPDDLTFDFDDALLYPDPALPASPEVVDPSPEPLASDGSAGSGLSWVNDLEQFLLEEEGGGVEGAGRDLAGEFFAGVFREEGDVDAESKGSARSEGEGRREAEEGAKVLDGEGNSSEESVGEGNEKNGRSGDDGATDKRRMRQIRNKDSAMKSRERKKMYVKDLEMKSKFLESECRRLDHLLRCIAAENIVLHQRLQTNRISSVLQAKQESAVLIKESLLLGSLFWLVSTVLLFLGSDLSCRPALWEAMEKARGLEISQNQEAGGTKRLENELRLAPRPGPFFMGRTCKGFRTRMKMIRPLSFREVLV